MLPKGKEHHFIGVASLAESIEALSELRNFDSRFGRQDSRFLEDKQSDDHTGKQSERGRFHIRGRLEKSIQSSERFRRSGVVDAALSIGASRKNLAAEQDAAVFCPVSSLTLSMRKPRARSRTTG